MILKKGTMMWSKPWLSLLESSLDCLHLTVWFQLLNPVMADLEEEADLRELDDLVGEKSANSLPGKGQSDDKHAFINNYYAQHSTSTKIIKTVATILGCSSMVSSCFLPPWISCEKMPKVSFLSFSAFSGNLCWNCWTNNTWSEGSSQRELWRNSQNFGGKKCWLLCWSCCWWCFSTQVNIQRKNIFMNDRNEKTTQTMQSCSDEKEFAKKRDKTFFCLFLVKTLERAEVSPMLPLDKTFLHENVSVLLLLYLWPGIHFTWKHSSSSLACLELLARLWCLGARICGCWVLCCTLKDGDRLSSTQVCRLENAANFYSFAWNINVKH